MKTPSNLGPRIGAATVIAIQALLGLYTIRFGPTHPIPMHFGLDGRVDRWGGRGEAGGVILMMALLSAATVLGIGWISKRRSQAGDRDRGLVAAQAITLAATSAICALILALTYGLVPANGGGVASMVVLCGILALTGAYLGTVSPNPMVGVRTPWTFASRLAWDKANRLACRLYFWGGLAGLVAAPLAPQPLAMQATIIGALAIAALCVFESWRVWRTDPDRGRVWF